MKPQIQIENKLNQVAHIWNDFIWDYKYCNSKIKFTEDVRSNYFGDILGYFKDTLHVVTHDNQYASYPDQFSYHIGLLQAMYIHQDFIEELLLIFRTNISKGDLKNDINYSINRGIRNELVGHPIRKVQVPKGMSEIDRCTECGMVKEPTKNKSVLLSSTIFANKTNRDNLIYLRYHKDNNYEFEKMSYSVSDIIDRHNIFLNEYLDIIICKLKSILEKYSDKLKEFEKKIDLLEFNALFRVTDLYYESIFHSDYIFDKESLLRIYDRRLEHLRYQNVIDEFYSYLRNGVKSSQEEIKRIFGKEIETETLEPRKPIEIKFVSRDELFEKFTEKSKRPEVSYHYELGKLASKRNYVDFDHFGGMLRSKCESNDLVCAELDHMENNISDKIEYYSSLKLIRKTILK